MTKTPLIIALVIASLLLTGCFESKPAIVDVQTSSTILPAQNDRSIDLAYTVDNKLTFGFQGKFEMVYEKKCLTITPDARDISLDAKRNLAFSSTVKPKTEWSGKIEDDCYGEHQITLVLYDQNKESVIDRESTTITLAKV